MLMPKKVKHRKHMKGSFRKIARSGFSIDFGNYALKALKGGRFSARQIEAARRAMTRYVQKGGKIWIRVFPDKPITSCGPENHMGGGKGPVDHFVAMIEPGRILFEMDGISKRVAYEALRLAAHKIPMRTKIISKESIK